MPRTREILSLMDCKGRKKRDTNERSLIHTPVISVLYMEVLSTLFQVSWQDSYSFADEDARYRLADQKWRTAVTCLGKVVPCLGRSCLGYENAQDKYIKSFTGLGWLVKLTNQRVNANRTNEMRLYCFTLDNQSLKQIYSQLFCLS